MKAEKEAQIIDQKAGRIMVSQELLGVSFFLVAIVVFATIARILANYTDDQVAGAQVFLTLCGFATAIIVGFIANKVLSKKLDKLMAKKMSLIF